MRELARSFIRKENLLTASVPIENCLNKGFTSISCRNLWTEIPSMRRVADGSRWGKNVKSSKILPWLQLLKRNLLIKVPHHRFITKRSGGRSPLGSAVSFVAILAVHNQPKKRFMRWPTGSYVEKYEQLTSKVEVIHGG